MGPDYGTEKYRNQVETICKQLNAVEARADEIDNFLMVFILDASYSRAAICEARKILLREREQHRRP